MALSNELISQFAKLVTKENKTDNGTIVYGKVIVDEDGQKCVQLDGSTEKTPITDETDSSKISSTTDVKDGERVSVLIKNHTATITGNISAPAARTNDVVEVKQAQILLANRVQAQEGYIKDLQADVADIGELRAATAKINELEADNVKINETLEAQKAEITDLEAKKIDASVVQATYATIENLEAESAKVDVLEANFGKFEDATVKDLEAAKADITNLKAKDAEIEGLVADKATIGQLNATNAEVETLKAKDAEIEGLVADKATIGQLNAVDAKFNNLGSTYANIDFSNIKMAAVEKLFTDSGIIKDLIVKDEKITGELVGVTLKGDLVEAGTLKADRLVVKGSDGNYYALNTDFEAMPGVTPVEEDAIHGSVLVEKSIVAEKIAVTDLVAFGATIGGFQITEKSINSTTKPAVNSNTRGIYFDNEGQVAFGDGSQYFKYYKTSDGTYKLAIVADELHIGTKNVETSIKEAKDAADAAQQTADNNASDMAGFVSGFNQDIANLQTQIDGSITTWFGEVAPTNTNEPASKWTTADEKNVHLGDLYYDTITGYCYRWQVKNNAYSWQKITDTDVTKALEDAAKAQDTADQKRRVFYSQPTPPYDQGDLWVQGSDGDILRCQTAKVSGQSFNASDWVTASKYTDDTKANAAQIAANNAQTAADNAQADIDNLEIGGRNLIAKSNIEKSSDNYCTATYTPVTPLVAGNEYTISVCVTPAEGVTHLQPYLSRGNAIVTWLYCTGTDRQILSGTFTARYASGYYPENGISNADIQIYRFPNDGTVTGVTTIHWIKVEKGNRATDWTPAPEDVETRVTTVETRVTDAETAINQNKEAIELRATKEEVTEQLIYRDPVGTVSGNASVRIDDASSVQHEMGVKLHRKNLVPDSRSSATFTRFWQLATFDILADYIGETITVSFDMKLDSLVTDSSRMRCYAYQGQGITIGLESDVVLTSVTSEWQRFSFVGTAVDLGIQNESYTKGGIAFYDPNGNNIYSVRNVQIELGSEATGYVPYVDFTKKVPKKNLIPYPYYEAVTNTLNGVTFNVHDDGRVVFSGIATKAFSYTFASSMLLSKGTYTYSYSGTLGSGATLRVYGNSTTWALLNSTTRAKTFTLAEDTYAQIYWHTSNTTDTLSGDIGLQLEAGSVATEYEPYQLVSSVNASTYGKNLIPYPYYHATRTINGIAFTDNGDGTITVNGTATAATYFTLAIREIYTLRAGKYYMSGNPVIGTQLYIINADSSLYKYDGGHGVAFDNPTAQNVLIAIMIPNGVTVDNALFKPQLELGTEATEYEPYKQPATYYANEDGSVDGVMSVYPTTTLMSNSPYVVIDCEYNKDNVFGDDLANQASLERRVTRSETNIANLTVSNDNITAEVQKNTKLINDTQNSLDARLIEVEKKASVSVTEDAVNIAINTALTETGAAKVVTKTGYSFTDDGMIVQKSSNPEMKTQITEDGMTVSKNDTPTLKADNTGVDAVNLRASTYLIVGGRSRFQNIPGTNRTGCFWIGG